MRRSFPLIPAGPAQTRIFTTCSFLSRAAFLCTKRQQGAMCVYVPRYTHPWWQSPSASQGSTEVLCPLLAPRTVLPPQPGSDPDAHMGPIFCPGSASRLLTQGSGHVHRCSQERNLGFWPRTTSSRLPPAIKESSLTSEVLGGRIFLIYIFFFNLQSHMARLF